MRPTVPPARLLSRARRTDSLAGFVQVKDVDKVALRRCLKLALEGAEAMLAVQEDDGVAEREKQPGAQVAHVRWRAAVRHTVARIAVGMRVRYVLVRSEGMGRLRTSHTHALGTRVRARVAWTYSAETAPRMPELKLSRNRTVSFSSGTVVPPDCAASPRPARPLCELAFEPAPAISVLWRAP